MTDDESPASIPENPKQSLNQRPESPQRPSKIARIDGEDLIDDDDDDDDEVEGQKESDILSSENMTQNPRIQRYLVAIEYIGTRFAGAQQQPNCRTVVGVLEEAFHKFIGQPVSIFCSSRTDAGVHALSNVCHVDVERISKRRPGEVLPHHEPAVVRRAVNHFLQDCLGSLSFTSGGPRLDSACRNFPEGHPHQKNEGDIMVIDVRCVTPDFHARYKAQERTYFYRLLSGPEPLSTFEKDQAWHVPKELDLLAMQRACKVLVGRHDFSSFRAASCEAKSPIRTLEELNVTEVVSTPYFPSILEREQSSFMGEDPCGCSNKLKTDLPHSALISNQDKVGSSNGESHQEFGIRRRHRCYVVTARARSFLYHQVRLLVGVLKAVGTGDLTVSDVERILNAKTVTAASPMAPACGLYLGRVNYNLP